MNEGKSVQSKGSIRFIRIAGPKFGEESDDLSVVLMWCDYDTTKILRRWRKNKKRKGLVKRDNISNLHYEL